MTESCGGKQASGKRHPGDFLIWIIACAIFVVEIRQDAEQDNKRPKQDE